MEDQEVIDRLDRLEGRLKQAERILHDELEERRQAMGRITRVAAELASALARLEAVEADHRQMQSNVHMAGAALVTGVEPASS